MEFLQQYLGEILSLSTAVVWAMAVVFFRRSGEAVHPIGLNLFKDVLAVLLFLPTFWLFGEVLLRPAPFSDYALVLASGAIGIGIADTLFFKSLNTLGAGLVAIVDCLYSPSIIALSILWLGESLSVWQVVGVALIISAVLTATQEGKSRQTNRRQMWLGFFWGGLAQMIMAVGIVMIKPLLDRSPLLWVTEFRLLGGVLVLLAILAFHPARRAILGSIRSRQRWIYTLSGSFTGGYLAMLLWLAGMKFTQASVSSALNQSSNIFIFIAAALFLREPITAVRMIGILLGVGGVLMVIFL